MKSNKQTMMSIGLGLGALVFAFFLILSDPNQGGQMMEQIKQTTANITQAATAPAPPSPPNALGPETRMDVQMPTPTPSSGQPINMMPPSSQGNSQNSSQQVSLGDAEKYLNSAWDSKPAAGSKMVPMQQHQRMMPIKRQQMMPMQRQQMMPFPQQQGFPQQGGGFGGREGGGGGGLRQLMMQMQQQQQGGGGADPNASARMESARDAVQYELGVARAEASQASNCMNRAQNSSDGSEKESAANEARYHANQARAAAGRAASRAGGISEVQGMVGQIRNIASQAEYSAEQASSAAAGW